MRKSRIFLPDINVWIALAADKHIHHLAAQNWFDAVDPGGAAFCRVTQMGFLRLITKPQVMREDVLDQRTAWRVYEQLARDSRLVFAGEPANLEPVWKRLTQGLFSGTNVWTDAYLAALALVEGLTLVSFDQGFQKIDGLGLIILGRVH